MAAVPQKLDPAVVGQDEQIEDKQDVYGARDVDDDEEYTVPEQRKIIRKVDLRLLILLGLMQCVSFIDRGNISNAAVAGMSADLHTGISNRYGLGFVKSWTQLIPLRVLLGAFEAGGVPGQYFLISSWYSRYDLHERTSIFYLIGVFGSAMSGVFGFLFSKMDGVSGLEGWRWIFIMEGIITCCIALAGYMFMVDFPDNAHKAWRFLTEKEGAFIIRRINRDRLDAEPEAFSFQRFLRPALDLKIWGFALLFCCTTIQAYATGFFLPVILKEKLKFSAGAAQGLSTPPYLVGMVLMYCEGVLSDKIRLRYPFLYFNACLTIVGLCLLAWGPSAGVQYFGAILSTAGPSANLPAIMTFQANNVRGTWKRAFSSASMIGMGGIGGITGSLVFRSQDAPKYLPGIYCCMTANGVTLLTTASLVTYFIMQNRAAARKEVVIERLVGFRYAI